MQDMTDKSIQDEAAADSGANGADQGVKIPVTPQTPNSTLGEKAPNVDALVHEYERKYQNFRDNEGPSVRKTTDGTNGSQKAKKRPYTPIYSGDATENERLWAGIAHASVLLALLLGIPSGGLATLVTLFVPLMIYFYFREKSEFVAYHAMQAFALQVLGTVGWFAILVTGVLAAGLLMVLLAVTIVGLIVVPFVALAMILFVVASFALPIGMVVFGLIAAWESYQGHWYSVPYIGRWIDQHMHGGLLSRV
jgi:uncharacterized protein